LYFHTFQSWIRLKTSVDDNTVSFQHSLTNN